MQQVGSPSIAIALHCYGQKEYNINTLLRSLIFPRFKYLFFSPIFSSLHTSSLDLAQEKSNGKGSLASILGHLFHGTRFQNLCSTFWLKEKPLRGLSNLAERILPSKVFISYCSSEFTTTLYNRRFLWLHQLLTKSKLESRSIPGPWVPNPLSVIQKLQTLNQLGDVPIVMQRTEAMKSIARVVEGPKKWKDKLRHWS